MSDEKKEEKYVKKEDEKTIAEKRVERRKIKRSRYERIHEN
jgi:hypothetical protein